MQLSSLFNVVMDREQDYKLFLSISDNFKLFHLTRLINMLVTEHILCLVYICSGFCSKISMQICFGSLAAFHSRPQRRPVPNPRRFDAGQRPPTC